VPTVGLQSCTLSVDVAEVLPDGHEKQLLFRPVTFEYVPTGHFWHGVLALLSASTSPAAQIVQSSIESDPRAA
jgi:hypothetical protein